MKNLRGRAPSTEFPETRVSGNLANSISAPKILQRWTSAQFLAKIQRKGLRRAQIRGRRKKLSKKKGLELRALRERERASENQDRERKTRNST